MFDVCVLVHCEDVLVMRSLRDGHGAVLLFVRGCRCEDRDRSVDVASTSRCGMACARSMCGVVLGPSVELCNDLECFR